MARKTFWIDKKSRFNSLKLPTKDSILTRWAAHPFFNSSPVWPRTIQNSKKSVKKLLKRLSRKLQKVSVMNNSLR